MYTANNNPTTEQIQLLSLVSNNLIVPTWRKDFALGLANFPSHKLSVNQTNWITRILIDSLGAAPVTAPVRNNLNPQVDISNIMKLFEVAKKHLKRPKIWLQTATGKDVKIRLNEFGNDAGCLSLNSNGYYSTWYGVLDPVKNEARLRRAADPIKQEILDLIYEFNKDPAGVAAKYGKLLSRCSFCALPLSTPESLAVGYGEVCAYHYHLDWGTKLYSKMDLAAEYHVENGVTV